MRSVSIARVLSIALLAGCSSAPVATDAAVDAGADAAQDAAQDAGRDASALEADAGSPGDDAGVDAGPPVEGPPEVVYLDFPDGESGLGPYGRRLVARPGGGFFALFTLLLEEPPSYAELVRLTAHGEVVWQRRLAIDAGSANAEFWDGGLAVDPDTRELVFAYPVEDDLVVLRLSDEGELVSGVRIDAPAPDRFDAGDNNNNGPVQVVPRAGEVTIAASLVNGTRDAYLAHLGADGTLVWQRRFRSPIAAQDYPTALIELPDGYLFVIGSQGFSEEGGEVFGIPVRYSHVWVLRLDPMGMPRWSTVFGTDGADVIRDVIYLGESTGFRLAGATGRRDQPWLAGMRSDGLVTLSRHYSAWPTYAAFGQWLFRTPSGRLLFTGDGSWVFEVEGDGTIVHARVLHELHSTWGAALEGETLVTLGTPTCVHPDCYASSAGSDAFFIRYGARPTPCTAALAYPDATVMSRAIAVWQGFVDEAPVPVEAEVSPYEPAFAPSSPITSRAYCVPPFD